MTRTMYIKMKIENFDIFLISSAVQAKLKIIAININIRKRILFARLILFSSPSKKD